MSAVENVSAEEVIQSLTGFDEIAIEKHMGIDPYLQAEEKPIGVLRALVFVLKTREGLDPKSAKQAAMEMTMGQIDAMFVNEPEVDPDQPITESGKDSSQPELPLRNLPPSAS